MYFIKSVSWLRLAAAQMKFLRYLLGITKLDSDRNQSVKEKLEEQNIVLKYNSTNENGHST
jgi:hypothetical protein